MSVVVGRIHTDPIMTFKYLCLGHNTIRGAAGGGILSAELYVATGLGLCRLNKYSIIWCIWMVKRKLREPLEDRKASFSLTASRSRN